jgi:hypothetical protein
MLQGMEIDIYLGEEGKRVPSKPVYGTEFAQTGIFIFQVAKYSQQKEWCSGSTKI